MEQLVKIRRVYDDGTAQVIRIRESACSGDCHKCAGCGAQQQALLLDAVNAIGAKEGEFVILRADTAPVLKAAAILYMLPLALFFAGYALGESLWQLGAAAGCIAFALGIAAVILYDRKVMRKNKTVYTITGYPSNRDGKTHTKGDNDLD